MRIRAALTVLTAALAVSSLAACSSGGTSSSPSDQPASGAASSSSTGAGDALAELQDSGVLRVGTEGTYAPFTYHDSSSGDLTGYDIDVITAVADKLGVKPEFSEVKWDAIFAGLEAKRFDIIANQVTVNPERVEKYDVSDPYTDSEPVVIVRADETSITSLADVAGKTSAQSATSNWAELATESGATVEPVDGLTEAVAALKDGRVDLTFNDNLAALNYLSTTGDTSVKVAFDLPDQAVSQALVLRKDSGLLDAVNQALAELRADGTLAELGSKYFGEDVSGTGDAADGSTESGQD
ncbi:MAG: transporter substrate-binding domain-containing protein [Actinomyces sp.]|jgi:ABC-type amino acid transport substrate-binding protein|nr:transporter substrate-binding domain-containing protein [Actinomyces sp.]MCI1788964.1 transporter substrate-binding domain-containing protein [Actinomyces sp.]MCI1829767.1 transporter substrate-binding domain-containing protein [Actinomyces sp.]